MTKSISILIILVLAAGCSAEKEPKTTGASIPVDSKTQSIATAPPATTPPGSAPKASAAIAVDSEGLRIFTEPGGSARAIAFGTDEATTLSVVEKLRGKAERGRGEECGAGPVDFAQFGGFTLLFQDGKFGGWALSAQEAGGIGTANGIAIGSRRSALDAAFGKAKVDTESTLGIEFYTGGDSEGGISGLLDGKGQDGRVTSLWAGLNCVFR